MSSTKWRLYITATSGSSYANIAEFGMHESVGGANVCTGGTATASSSYDSSSLPANAFDADSSTLWANLSAVPQWLQYEFGAAKTIVEYTVQKALIGVGMAQDWDLQYYDGATWQTVDSQSNQVGWTAGEVRTYVACLSVPPTVVSPSFAVPQLSVVSSGHFDVPAFDASPICVPPDIKSFAFAIPETSVSPTFAVPDLSGTQVIASVDVTNPVEDVDTSITISVLCTVDVLNPVEDLEAETVISLVADVTVDNPVSTVEVSVVLGILPSDWTVTNPVSTVDCGLVITLSASVDVLNPPATVEVTAQFGTKTVVINIENNGRTEYTNFGFDSFAVWDGQLVGTMNGNIYTLGGVDDDGSLITMTFRTGQGNFGDMHKKNVPDAFLSVQGAATIKTVTDNDKESSAVSVQGDFKSKRAKLPLGRQSVYWGVQMDSNDPSCVVSEIELLMDLAQRR